MDTIKKLRKTFGVSQAELAKRTGISQSEISRFENKERTPTQEQYNLMFNQVAPMDTPVKDIKVAAQLLEIFEFTPRDLAYLFFMLQLMTEEDYSQSLDRQQAQWLIEFLLNGKTLRRQVKQLERDLNHFDAYYVYGKKPLKSSWKTERAVMADGQEILVPIIGKTPLSLEKNKEQESQWANLQVQLCFRAKCIECLIQDEKYKHFVLDFVQGTPLDELSEMYRIDDPREKMIELAMKYIRVNRFARK